MPLWDIEELLDLHKTEFAKLAQARVLELCTLWGPVPRSVLTYASDPDFQAEQEALITAYRHSSLMSLLEEWQMTPTLTGMSPEQSFTCTLMKPTALLALGLHQISLQTSLSIIKEAKNSRK